MQRHNTITKNFCAHKQTSICPYLRLVRPHTLKRRTQKEEDDASAEHNALSPPKKHKNNSHKHCTPHCGKLAAQLHGQPIAAAPASSTRRARISRPPPQKKHKNQKKTARASLRPIAHTRSPYLSLSFLSFVFLQVSEKRQEPANKMDSQFERIEWDYFTALEKSWIPQQQEVAAADFFEAFAARVGGRNGKRLLERLWSMQLQGRLVEAATLLLMPQDQLVAATISSDAYSNHERAARREKVKGVIESGAVEEIERKAARMLEALVERRCSMTDAGQLVIIVIHDAVTRPDVWADLSWWGGDANSPGPRLDLASAILRLAAECDLRAEMPEWYEQCVLRVLTHGRIPPKKWSPLPGPLHAFFSWTDAGAAAKRDVEVVRPFLRWQQGCVRDEDGGERGLKECCRSHNAAVLFQAALRELLPRTIAPLAENVPLYAHRSGDAALDEISTLLAN